MRDETDLPIPEAGSLRRGRFTYFPVVPGRLEFAIEVRRAILRERPEVVALELPASLQVRLDARHRTPSRNVAHLLSGGRTGRRTGHLRAGGTGRPFHRSHSQRVGSGREDRVCRSRSGRTAPSERRLPGHLCDSPHRPGALRGGLPRVPAAPHGGDFAARGRHRLEIAGRRPAGARHGGGLAESARSAAGCHGGAAGAADRQNAPRGRGVAASASRFAGRDRRRVSVPAVALRKFPSGDGGRQPDRPPARATRGLPRSGEGIRGQHRGAHGTLAAAAAGPLHAQPGAERKRTGGRHLRPHGGGARRGRRQLRLGRMGGRRPLSAAEDLRRPAQRPHLRRGDVARYTPHPASPAPAQHQAAPAPLTDSSRARRRSFPANGRAR